MDAAIVDGTASLTTLIHGLRARGLWRDQRGANLLDGGAPFYDVYACADNRFLAVAAIEPQFHAELVARAGGPVEAADQYAFDLWPQQKQQWAALFRTRTRDEWVALLADSDSCVAPALDWEEAAQHEHLVARGTFVDMDGALQPAPAPRFEVSTAPVPRPAPRVGEHTDEIVAELDDG